MRKFHGLTLKDYKRSLTGQNWQHHDPTILHSLSFSLITVYLSSKHSISPVTADRAEFFLQIWHWISYVHLEYLPEIFFFFMDIAWIVH
jgi:hypothetical protein